MACALHIIDRDTPADMLGQVSLLAAQDERIVCIGPVPAQPLLGRDVTQVHRSGNLAELCGSRVAAQIGQAKVLHAWSSHAAQAAADCGRKRRLPVVLSLPALPEPAGLSRLAADAKRNGYHLTLPTHASAMELIGAIQAVGTVHILPPPARAPDNVSARRQATRQALGCGNDETLLLAPAEMTLHAGHRHACWTHAILRFMELKVRLVLPGDGPAADKVRAFAPTTGFQEDVFLTGWRFSLDDLLAAADVAMFLAERDEGLWAMAQAMAAGMPIVASSTPDLAWCAPDNQAALLVPPGDPRAAAAAALRLIEDTDLARRLGSAAAVRTAEFLEPSWVRQELDHIYDACGHAGTA